MNDNMDQIIAEIRKVEAERDEALAAMRKVAQERQDALAEFRLARNRADALGEMLTAAENAAGCSVQSPSLVQAIMALQLSLEECVEVISDVKAERDRLEDINNLLQQELAGYRVQMPVIREAFVKQVEECAQVNSLLEYHRELLAQAVKDRNAAEAERDRLREERDMLLTERDHLFDKLADAHREAAK